MKRLLGTGGMGSVYKAENTTIGRTVAVKVLHPHLADDGVALTRFQREARAAAGMQHPHVVQVLDIDHAEDAADKWSRSGALGDHTTCHISFCT